MALYKLQNKTTKPLKEEKVKLEKDLQGLIEANLDTLFGLDFVSTEFQHNNLRIDTLAFDEENNSFVIIEYKKDKSFSVIDQGYAYLSLMLDNKSEFILEYNEQKQARMQRGTLDWSQSRVLFVANQFNTHQKQAINFKDMPIELWEAKLYEAGLLHMNQIQSSSHAESIETVATDKQVKEVSREVKTYTVDDHFKEGWEESRAIFDELSDRILALDDRIIVKPRKQYIGFKIDKSLLVEVHTYKSKIDIWLPRVKPEDVQDPEGRVQYVKDSLKYFNRHISQYVLTEGDEAEMQYAVSLVKQILQKFF